MKNTLLIFALVFTTVFMSCNENTKEKASDAMPMLNALDEDKETTSKMCFLSLGEPFMVEDVQLQDSTYLTVSIANNKVEGVFNWIPAEKDARRGTFEGAKNGNYIKGMYSYTQEGMPESTTINIEIKDNKAIVTTAKDEPSQMMLTVDKGDCAVWDE